jgi:hypothetical protein
MKCLQNLKRVTVKLKVKNKLIQDASNELYNELMKIKIDKGDLFDSTIVGNEDLDDRYDLHQDEMEFN